MFTLRRRHGILFFRFLWSFGGKCVFLQKYSTGGKHGHIHQQGKRGVPPGAQLRICGQVGTDSRSEQDALHRA